MCSVYTNAFYTAVQLFQTHAHNTAAKFSAHFVTHDRGDGDYAVPNFATSKVPI